MSATPELPNAPKPPAAGVLITLGLGGLGRLGVGPVRARSRMQIVTGRIQQIIPTSLQHMRGAAIAGATVPRPPRRAAGPPSEEKRCGRLARGSFLVGQVKSSLTGLDALTGSYLTKPSMTGDSYAGIC